MGRKKRGDDFLDLPDADEGGPAEVEAEEPAKPAPKGGKKGKKGKNAGFMDLPDPEADDNDESAAPAAPPAATKPTGGAAKKAKGKKGKGGNKFDAAFGSDDDDEVERRLAAAAAAGSEEEEEEEEEAPAPAKPAASKAKKGKKGSSGGGAASAFALLGGEDEEEEEEQQEEEEEEEAQRSSATGFAALMGDEDGGDEEEEEESAPAPKKEKKEKKDKKKKSKDLDSLFAALGEDGGAEEAAGDNAEEAPKKEKKEKKKKSKDLDSLFNALGEEGNIGEAAEGEEAAKKEKKEKKKKKDADTLFAALEAEGAEVPKKEKKEKKDKDKKDKKKKDTDALFAALGEDSSAAAPAPAAAAPEPAPAAKPAPPKKGKPVAAASKEEDAELDALLAELDAPKAAPAAAEGGGKKKKKKGGKGGAGAGGDDEDIDALLAEIDGPSAPKPAAAEAAAAPAAAAADGEAAAGGDDEDGGEDLEAMAAAGKELTAAQKKRLKKKQKEKEKKAAEKAGGAAGGEEAAAAAGGEEEGAAAGGAKKGAKPVKESAAVRRMREALELRQKLEAEARAAEEARRQAEEEEIRRLEEEERKKAEEKERKKAAAKAKKEELKRQGKLLTGKAKAEAERLAAMRAQLLAQAAEKGIELPVGDSAEGEAAAAAEEPKKKKVVYATKKQLQRKKSEARSEVDGAADAAAAASSSSAPAAADSAAAAAAAPEQPPAAAAAAQTEAAAAAPVAAEAEAAAPAAAAAEGDWEAAADSWEELEDAPVIPIVPGAKKGEEEEEEETKKQQQQKKADVKVEKAANGKAKTAAQEEEEEEESGSEEEEEGSGSEEEGSGSEEEEEESGSDEEESGSEEEDESSSEYTSSDEDDSSEDSDDAKERRIEEARARRLARLETARATADRSQLRSPICCILGHVDVGKTKILDNIRRTNVQDGEAGGITQQIGATFIPADAIEKRTAPLRGSRDFDMKLPGLLVIDTPGHESFTNLRARGSGLCDIAVLIVDLMHGLEQQTIESINLLKMRRTPFIIALNKVDRLYGWKSNADIPIREAFKRQKDHVMREFDDRSSQVFLQLNEQGLNVSLYWKNPDPRKYVNVVPTSAITGEGISDLLQLMVKLTQSMMVERLTLLSETQCTVLEVKTLEGLGTTIDVVLMNGTLKEGDRIVACGLQGPIVTRIKALKTPQVLKEMRVKGQLMDHKEIKAAMGAKIVAPGLEHAVAGTSLYVIGPDDDEEELRDAVMEDMADIFSKVDKSGEGVCVQASTLGSLEALLAFLDSDDVQIPVSGINIGPVHKKDVLRANVMAEKGYKKYAVILAFDVPVAPQARDLAQELGVKIFTADIIYHLFDQFTAYMKEIKAQEQERARFEAVFPCILQIIPTCVFNMRDPIVLGVEVVEGIAKVGTPIAIPTKAGIELGRIASMELNHKAVDTVRSGNSVAMKIEGTNAEQQARMYGRHFDHNDQLVSKISRESINALKSHFQDEMTKDDWRLIIKLKKVFQVN